MRDAQLHLDGSVPMYVPHSHLDREYHWNKKWRPRLNLDAPLLVCNASKARTLDNTYIFSERATGRLKRRHAPLFTTIGKFVL